jgi:hypothetical protein
MSCLLAACITLGVTLNSYEGLEDTRSFNLKVGNDAYVWTSYETPRMRILGQGLSDAELFGVGLGFRHKVDAISFFGEVGYVMTSTEDKPTVRDEIVYTTLVGNHGVRTIPSRDPQYNEGAHTAYELDSGVLGRFGVGYTHKDVTVSMAYRFLRIEEYIRLWDDDVIATTGGWWEEHNSRDLSAFEIGLSYEF